MTKEEFRKSKEYKEALEKIMNYSKGYRFTLSYATMPIGKRKAMRILMMDCEAMRLVESIGIGISLEGLFVSETYKRL